MSSNHGSNLKEVEAMWMVLVLTMKPVPSSPDLLGGPYMEGKNMDFICQVGFFLGKSTLCLLGQLLGHHLSQAV